MNQPSAGIRGPVEPGGHGQEDGARQRGHRQQRQEAPRNPARQGRGGGGRGERCASDTSGARRSGGDGSLDSLSIFFLDATHFMGVLNVI